jgi:hypothetical protein
MVTSDPRRFHTLPSSSPITPAPITPRRFGTVSKSSAPTLSTMRAVELRERQFDRVRTGRQDHVGALQFDFAAIVLLHLDDVARLQLAEAVERAHLVRLEQRGDAAGELLHDLVLAGDHRWPRRSPASRS